MSSATIPTTLPSRTTASPLLSGQPVAWTKLLVHSCFGCLLLLDSLYLVLCYITFDFFGALNSPFFGWLRGGASVAWLVYFPMLAAALFSVEIGQAGAKKRKLLYLAFIFLMIQVGAGLLLYLIPGSQAQFAWALVYGPDVRLQHGEITDYLQALACLVPLIWVSGIHIAGSFRSVAAGVAANTMTLTSFLAAGLTTSLLYEGGGVLRRAHGGAPASLSAMILGLGAHLVIFLIIFLVLQWIRVIANRFPDPGIAQFAIRCLAAWLLLAWIVRRIIFSLLAFNDRLANAYAMLFSFALVVFIASLLLRIKQQRIAGPDQSGQSRQSVWVVRFCVLAAILAFSYVCGVKLAPIDWAHVIGSVGAIAVWTLLLWFCVTIRRRNRTYGPAFLVFASVVGVLGLAGMRLALAPGALADTLEQYADYNSSAFVIQQAFKPAIQDEKYAAWYAFLNNHAMIRPPVAAPDVPLAAKLKPVKGNKPHIFLLVIDALRRDYVSAYNPAVTFTPNMQAFARESVVFQHAYSPYAGTALADPALWAGFQQISKAFPQPLPNENNLGKMLEVDGYDSYICYNTIVGFLAGDARDVTRLNTDRSDQLDFAPTMKQLEDDLLKRKDPTRPIFAFAQPTNVHTLSLAWHGGRVAVTPHPGFDDAYASGVERVDQTFGEFIVFLKEHGLYENSIVILTADHGESLGEMGRESHVSNVTPEVIGVPLIVHLPDHQKSALVWDANTVAMLHDITPTLYYLVGHRPLNSGEMLGRPLFTLNGDEQHLYHPDHYFLMSSYEPVFGILSADQKSLFMVDAVLHRNYYYNLEVDPSALKNRITVPLRDEYEAIIRRDLEKIDQFYNVSEQELSAR